MNRIFRIPRPCRHLTISTAVLLAGAMLAGPGAHAQVPVDEQGNPLAPIGSADDSYYEISDDATQYEDAISEEPVPALTPAELETLIGPVALYPDDLLAIVLPASTYPLQIVQAARFLEEYETDSSITPDEEWDESITALLNYPEVVHMLNDDIDWTWKLGEAVVRQQQGVIAAVESFRDRAYAAGNLKSDDYQDVTETEGIIEIIPIEEDTIYVPYYEPQHVVVSQAAPVYHYYPRAYPVYYYPYPYGHSFTAHRFWGVTTAFRIGWHSNFVQVQHPSYWGHPYYGRDYYAHYYRSPSISFYNATYVHRGNRSLSQRYSSGDYWRPRRNSGVRPGNYRASTRSYRTNERSSGRAVDRRSNYGSRSRGDTNLNAANTRRNTVGSTSRNMVGSKRNDDIRFRSRGDSNGADSRRSVQSVRTNQVTANRTARPTTTTASRKTTPVPTRQTRQMERRSQPSTRASTSTRRAAPAQTSRRATPTPTRQPTKRSTNQTRSTAKVTRTETRNSAKASGRQSSRRTQRH